MKRSPFHATCLPSLGRALSAVAFSLLASHAWAIEPAAVIAESARARVTIADYDAEINKLSPAARAEFAANRLRLTQFLDTLYTSRVLAADARAAGLDRDPLIARQIAIQIDRMLATARYAQLDAAAGAQFDQAIDQYTARAREIYASTKSKYAIAEQVRAAHILINGASEESRKKAEEVRAKALAGADFTALAREYCRTRARRATAANWDSSRRRPWTRNNLPPRRSR